MADNNGWGGNNDAQNNSEWGATPPPPPPVRHEETEVLPVVPPTPPAPPAPPTPPQAAEVPQQPVPAPQFQQPESYPPQYQQPVVYQEPKKSKLGWIIGGIMAAIILIGAGVYALWYFGYIGSEPEPVEVTVTKSKPARPAKDDDKEDKTEEPTEKKQAEQDIVPLPAGAVACGTSGGFTVHAGTSVTSCQFSRNVGTAAATLPETGGVLNVYSPVTNRNYTMTCSPVGSNRFDCTGGNNALVHLTR